MKRNRVMDLQGINISQLTFAEKTEIKKICPATDDLFISQSSSKNGNFC
jgi:hypothetical protein